MFPPEFLGDIHDSWWEPWVLIRSVVSWWEELSLLKIRRTTWWLLVLESAWQWLRPLRVRGELPPRGVSWCVRYGARCRRTSTAAFCAELRQTQLVQLCRGRGCAFLFGAFVIVGTVSPMVHRALSFRKPMARSVAERARGTTTGSPRRVTYYGGFLERGLSLELKIRTCRLALPISSTPAKNAQASPAGS